MIDQTWILKEYQMCESKTHMITNESINTIEYKAYLSHKLNVIIRDKVSTQIQNNRMHVIEWSTPIKHSNQSIYEKITYVGSHQNPIDLAWINIINSIILELWKLLLGLSKIMKNKKIIRNQKKSQDACLNKKWQ